MIFSIMVVFSIFLGSMSFVQGKIVLNSMAGQYNLGDDVSQTMSVMTVDNFQGFLRASLYCRSQETLIFYSPISTLSNKEKTFSFTFIASQEGVCYIQATLEKDSIVDETLSSNFEITSKINIVPSLNKQFFMPKEELKISGKVAMVGGKEFNGAARIILDEKEYSVIVYRGSFLESINLDKGIAPGQHNLIMHLNDDKGNKGLTNITFEVGVVKTGLIIKTDKDMIIPGEIILIYPMVVDQAGNQIDEPVSLKITQKESIGLGFQKTIVLLNEVLNTTNQTNQTPYLQYKFSLDAPPQDYIIEASGAGFTAQKIVHVPVVEKISYEIIDSVLIIKNIGNVVYQKPIELSFTMGDIKVEKIINPKIKVNGQLEYSLNDLKAPQGEYDLSLKSEDTNEIVSQVPLGVTGQASGSLNLEDSRESILVPAIIILVILLIVVIVIERKFFINIFKSKKKKRQLPATFHGYEFYNDEPKDSKPSDMSVSKKSLSSSVSSQIPNKAVKMDAPQKTPSSIKMSEIAKQHQKSRIEESTSQDKRVFSSRIDVIKTLFDKYAQGLSASKIEPKTIAGQKKEVSVLMIRINGMNDLIALKNKDSFLFNELTDTYFSKVLKKIQVNGGVADLYDNHFIIFFNVNPQANHQAMALKTAQEIKKITQELNQELAVRGQAFHINVSAGLHAGPLITSSIGADKALKYMPVADTTNIAKALEKKAFKGEIIMSEAFYNQVSGITPAKKITPLSMGNKAMNAYLVQEQVVEKKNIPYWAK